MNLTTFALNHRYAILALGLLIAVMGMFGYRNTPVDLFPETAPPQVLVITQQPGASADDVADKLTEIVEQEISTLSELKNITSTSRDQVSSVKAEFYYTKSPAEAVMEVQNALGRITSDLPDEAMEPAVYQISDASSRALITLALSPRENSRKDLASIRLVAENQIRNSFLRLRHIADVEVFGANDPEVKIFLNRNKLAAQSIFPEQVLSAIAGQNISAPAGNLYTRKHEYVVKTTGEFRNLEDLRRLPVLKNEQGFVRLGDLARIELGVMEARSRYLGNGREAIAMNLMRAEGGKTVAAIEEAKALLPKLKAEYPDIRFEITDDQAPLINLNLSGMRNSIIQAIILTVLVIFVFLANIQSALIVAISIPLAFLFTLSILWWTPFTLNMITLSGIIVSIGMVVDASVVTIENIFRRFKEDDNGDTVQAASSGTNQVSMAITAGMLTTVVVLIPVIFIGGYPQRTIGRLSFVITTTLLASLMVALTVVPLLSARLLKSAHRQNMLERTAARADRLIQWVRTFYLWLLRKALQWQAITLVLAGLFFVFTVKNVPALLGGELMPPMDTGIVTVAFITPATDSPDQVVSVLEDVESVIRKQPGILRTSSILGSEPGAVSFGSGGATSQSAMLTVHLVDRTKREATIWEIQDSWRKELANISGIQSFRVSEYGATPMATTKAPLDIIVSGPDPRILDNLANQIMDSLHGMPGLVDVQRSWYFDEREQNVIVDPALALTYGTSSAKVASELNTAIQGVPVSKLRLDDYLDIPIRAQYRPEDLNDVEDLSQVYVSSRFGPVPLSAMAKVNEKRTRPYVTREGLENTIDITGVNHTYTIQQVGKMAAKRLANLDLPRDYTLEVAGTPKDMADTNKRLRGALGIGISLLYILLLAMFRSFTAPLVILSAVPLAVAGALWGLLLFDKPMSMPGNMGMIFLAGTVINNSVLLLDFINQARKGGMDRNKAIMESVSLRLRPILMTTFSTVIGLSPLVFEMAVGLERMSPLGIVASTGLLAGTLMTLVVVPVVYAVLDRLTFRIQQTLTRVKRKVLTVSS